MSKTEYLAARKAVEAEWENSLHALNALHKTPYEKKMAKICDQLQALMMQIGQDMEKDSKSIVTRDK